MSEVVQQYPYKIYLLFQTFVKVVLRNLSQVLSFLAIWSFFFKKKRGS